MRCALPARLYTFHEGSGNTVHDVSGVGSALDLAVTNPSAVTWLPGGGMSINSSTAIVSAGVATKVMDALQATQEVTVEAWAKPGNSSQFGPARMVALSVDPHPNGCNFVLGQSSSRYEMRLRTTLTNQYGKTPLQTAPGVVTLNLTHVVYTRDASGVTKMYLDGVNVETSFVGGNFSNWGNYVLTLANEPTETRPWLGLRAKSGHGRPARGRRGWPGRRANACWHRP